MTTEELNNQIDAQFQTVCDVLARRFNGNFTAGFEIDGERRVDFTGDGWEAENKFQRPDVGAKAAREVSALCKLLEKGSFDSYTVRLKWGLDGVWLCLSSYLPNHFGFSYSGYTKAFFERKGTTPTLVGV